VAEIPKQSSRIWSCYLCREAEGSMTLWDFGCRYELASGDSYFRQGMMGKALKKYLAVEKHYNDMVEDQFDFHTYCLRKMTLRAYIRMLRFQDHLHSHHFFCRAAGAAIR
jgi:peptide alpha-N-acetyltransferase